MHDDVERRYTCNHWTALYAGYLRWAGTRTLRNINPM